jgi:segregation and condensation protein A
MSEPEIRDTEFDLESPASENDSLIVEVDGFEGPLDLLLALARTQKVDLAKISVLKLADQYLLFVEKMRRRDLELAADYLVMAAWLAYLKSRLILPQPDTEEAKSAEEAAAQLRWRLQRLEAMRKAAARLLARDRLGRDVFARGNPEPVVVVRTRNHVDTLYDLLSAYSQQRIRHVGHGAYALMRPPVLLIEDARDRLERILGKIPQWNLLTKFLPGEWITGARRRSAVASMFSACLELTRDGKLEIRQLTTFGEVFIKDRQTEVGQENGVG